MCVRTRVCRSVQSLATMQLMSKQVNEKWCFHEITTLELKKLAELLTRLRGPTNQLPMYMHTVIMALLGWLYSMEASAQVAAKRVNKALATIIICLPRPLPVLSVHTQIFHICIYALNLSC